MVRGQAVIRKSPKEINLLGFNALYTKMAKKFLGDKDQVVVQVEFDDGEPYKTNKQLGYLYNCLGELAKTGYRGRGLNIADRNIAIEYLKLEEDMFVEHITDSDGNVLATIPKLIRSAKVKELRDFIERAAIWIAVEFSVVVPTPEEWLKPRKINKL